MKTHINILISFGLITLMSLPSCKKKKLEEDTKEANTVVSQTNAKMENIFDDLYDQIDQAADQEEDLNKLEIGTWKHITSACATVTLDPVGPDFPKTLTVDYGSNCTGADGKVRSGQIVCTFSGPYNQAGTVINATLVNYEVDQYAVEGSKTVTNQGTNGQGQPYFSVVVADVVVSWDGYQVNWESSRTRTWTEGYDTGFWTWDSTANTIMGFNGITDDRYELTGSASGTGVNGITYSLSITSPLTWGWDCWWIKQGTISIVPGGWDGATVDFGNGTCDNDATLTVNGNTYDIQM